METRQLTRLFAIGARAAAHNVEGVTHAESLVAPPAGGNCTNWVLGHIVASRGSLLELFGQAPPEGAERIQRYGRGSEPIAGGEAVELSELLSLLEASQARLTELFGELEEARLSAALPDGGSPVTGQSFGDALAFFAWHESYHLGQLGLLRRTLGKAGQIR